jgi:hypothetical protein
MPPNDRSVKSGKAQTEHMFCGLPQKADFPILELPLRQLFANAAIAASRGGFC